MSTKCVADVVFCIDASSSMQPCIDAVRQNLGQFMTGLQAGGQSTWDVRFDFLAHQASESGGQVGFLLQSLRAVDSSTLMKCLYSGSGTQSTFFSKDVEELKRGLARIKVAGDEAPFVALDTALDFPWRDSVACHRVVIFLTDEPLETGLMQDDQRAVLPRLIKKIEQLRVMLFLVAPESPAFDELCAVDKSEYQPTQGTSNGLTTVDFAKVLQQIGKSVSVAIGQQSQQKPPTAERGLFNQPNWGTISCEMRGA